MEIQIVRKILEENENLATTIRTRLREKRRSMVNFMSSPGSGKTMLLEKLIPELQKLDLRVGVIEGDITTMNDAQRLQPLNIPIAQINTEPFGGDCHLGANVVSSALDSLDSKDFDIALIENVGNLVCPAEFDTGADLNIVVLSLPEGEDKPLKYPLMFRTTQIALINKIDLASAVDADVPLMKENIRKIHPEIRILETSGKTGAGIPELAQWLVEAHRITIGPTQERA